MVYNVLKKILLLFLLLLCSCEEKPDEEIVVQVKSITLSQTTVSIAVGETIQLQVNVNPQNAAKKTIAWSSSDKAVASVDKDGNVTAVSVGTANVMVTIDGKNATCLVTVIKKVIPVESIALNENTLSLIEGESEALIATIYPDDATEKSVSWSTSDSAVASVDGKGIVTAIKAGEAIIKVKSGNIEAVCVVTVKLDGTPSGGLEGTGEEEMH